MIYFIFVVFSCCFGDIVFFVLFVVLVVFVMFVNIIIFFFIMYKFVICLFNVVDLSGGSEGFFKIKCVFGILIFVGIIWVFGFFVIVDVCFVFYYLFVICNSF